MSGRRGATERNVMSAASISPPHVSCLNVGSNSPSLLVFRGLVPCTFEICRSAPKQRVPLQTEHGRHTWTIIFLLIFWHTSWTRQWFSWGCCPLTFMLETWDFASFSLLIIADGFIVNSCKLSYGNNNPNHILLGNHAIKTEIFNTAKIFQIWTKLISLKAHLKDSKVCEFISLTLLLWLLSPFQILKTLSRIFFLFISYSKQNQKNLIKTATLEGGISMREERGARLGGDQPWSKDVTPDPTDRRSWEAIDESYF